MIDFQCRKADRNRLYYTFYEDIEHKVKPAVNIVVQGLHCVSPDLAEIFSHSLLTSFIAYNPKCEDMLCLCKEIIYSFCVIQV